MYDKLLGYLDRQDECKNLQYFVIKHKSGLFDIYLSCGKKEYNLKKIELDNVMYSKLISYIKELGNYEKWLIKRI